MDNELFLKIVLAIISILGTLVTSFLVPYIKSKTTAEQLANVKFWVEIAVKAAEQIFDIPESGEDKKAYVLKFLATKGIVLTVEELNALIESAVKELNLTQELLVAETLR
ncbi:MAG: phage holin, LLH family [bacterium]